MNYTNRFIQAYRQAPWRVQLQWSGLFLLGLVSIVIVAAVYLNISTQAASAGLEIQNLEIDKEETLRTIADLRTKQALLTSQLEMEKRAKDLGFVTTDPSQTTYLVVPGYPGRQAVILAPPPGPAGIKIPLIKPSYTQSLWEVLFQGVMTLSESNGAAAQ